MNIKWNAPTIICLVALLISHFGFNLGFAPPAASEAVQEGFPGRRTGGSTRGKCLIASHDLVALVPETLLSKIGVAPAQLLFAVPKLSVSRVAMLALLDEQGREVYLKNIEVPTDGGIVALNLPEPEILMQGWSMAERSQRFEWVFALQCDPENLAEDIIVQGWVEYVNPDPALVTQLDRAKPEQQVDLLAAAGLWSNALSTLAQLRQEYPSDLGLQDRWASLLQAEQLDPLVQAPLYLDLPQQEIRGGRLGLSIDSSHGSGESEVER